MAAPKTVQMAPNVPITMTIKYIDVWPNDTSKNNGKGYGASLALRGNIDGEDCRVYPKGFLDRNLRTLMQADIIELGQYADDPAEKYSIPVNDGADIQLLLQQPAGERYPAFTAINPRLMVPKPSGAPKPGREAPKNIPDDDGYLDSLTGIASPTVQATRTAQAAPTPLVTPIERMSACYGHALAIVKDAATIGGMTFTGEDVRATAITLFIQGAGR